MSSFTILLSFGTMQPMLLRKSHYINCGVMAVIRFSLVCGYLCFGSTCCFHLQGWPWLCRQLLWRVTIHLPNYKVSQHTSSHTEHWPLWKPQILYKKWAGTDTIFFCSVMARALYRKYYKFRGISIISLCMFNTRTSSINQKCLSGLALNCHNL
jgi:hypothetical protein